MTLPITSGTATLARATGVTSRIARNRIIELVFIDTESEHSVSRTFSQDPRRLKNRINRLRRFPQFNRKYVCRARHVGAKHQPFALTSKCHARLQTLSVFREVKACFGAQAT